MALNQCVRALPRAAGVLIEVWQPVKDACTHMEEWVHSLLTETCSNEGTDHILRRCVSPLTEAASLINSLDQVIFGGLKLRGI